MRLDGVISDYRIALLRKRMLVFLLEVEAHGHLGRSAVPCCLPNLWPVMRFFFPRFKHVILKNANERRLDENPRGNFILVQDSLF